VPLRKAGKHGWALLLAAASSAALIAGCGEDSRLRYADDTARLSAEALTEIESTSGGESPELAPLLERAHVRLGEIERSIDHWRNHSGYLAYATHAPCLRNALLALREALVAHDLGVPQQLDSAEAMLADVASHECEP
jgi:hypothetical protein